MRILVVDDDAFIRKLIGIHLKKEGFEALFASDGMEALNLLQQEPVDLAIVDVMMPKMDGVTLTKNLAEIGVPVLMLTAKTTLDDKEKGFLAGADDYMVKPFDFRELNARIKVLLKRKAEATVSVVAPEKLTYKDLQIDTNRREVMRQGSLIRLSPKEYNLLTYMVQNAERVISRIEIAEKVWNTHFDTGTNFIDVYINYLRKKIDKDFEIKLINTTNGIGFILNEVKPRK
mgnify:CR=1 FL=1